MLINFIIIAKRNLCIPNLCILSIKNTKLCLSYLKMGLEIFLIEKKEKKIFSHAQSNNFPKFPYELILQHKAIKNILMKSINNLKLENKTKMFTHRNTHTR